MSKKVYSVVVLLLFSVVTISANLNQSVYWSSSGNEPDVDTVLPLQDTTLTAGDLASTTIQVTDTPSLVYSPHIVVASSLAFHLLYCSEGDVFLASSWDGFDWASPVSVEQGATYNMYSADICQTSNGTLWIVATNNVGSPPTDTNIYLMSSSDGVIWSTPTELVATPTYDVFPRITVGSDDSLWVTYTHSVTSDMFGDWDIYVMNSTDGSDWSSPRQITNETIEEKWGAICVDTGGNYHVAYQAITGEGRGIRILSSSNGVDWGSSHEVVAPSWNLADGGSSLTQLDNGTFLNTFTTSDLPEGYGIGLSSSNDGVVWSAPKTVLSQAGSPQYTDIVVRSGWAWIPYVQNSGSNVFFTRFPVPPTTVWDDDFNDGDLDGWTVTEGAFSASEYTASGLTPLSNCVYHSSRLTAGTWSMDTIFGESGEQKIWFTVNDMDWGDFDRPLEGYYLLLTDTNTMGLWNNSDTVDQEKDACSIAGGLQGGHHIDITRTIDGLIRVYLDGSLCLELMDDSKIVSSFFYLQFDGRHAVDNITLSDEILITPPITTTTSTTTTTTTPTTTTTTTPSTTPTGSDSPDTTMLLVFGGVGVAVVVILIAVMRIKRK